MKFGNASQQKHFEQHVKGFIKNNESDVRELLPQIDTFMDEIQEDIQKIERNCDSLDVANFDKMLETIVKCKSPEIIKTKDVNNYTLGRNISYRESEDNPFEKAKPDNSVNMSQEEYKNLLKSIEVKVDKITELENKLKESDNSQKKKLKKKGNKSNRKLSKTQEERENMIKNSLAELDLLVDED